jgi:4-hydroxy-tetrahydrodipicolinate synthase
MTSELAGVVPITATPFDEHDRVDEDAIAALVEFELRCGVQGLNVLGIAGEAHKLGDGERERVAARFLKEVGGRVPVVVGTSHAGTGLAIELSRAAEAAGAAAVMVAPPAGLRSPAAIVAHYRAVGQAIGIPVVVQDEPVSTGVLMDPPLLGRIAGQVESCRYVKLEELPTPSKLTALRQVPGGDRVRVFGGANAMYFPEELGRGAIGIMTGFAFPDLLVQVHARFAAGDAVAAAALYDRYASYVRYEGQPGIGLALRKEVLRRRGALRTSRLRAPGPTLDAVTLAELDAILARTGLAARLAPGSAFGG